MKSFVKAIKPHRLFSHFIFDFDGTLADSRLNISNSINFALTSQGLAKIDPLKIHPFIGKKSIEDTFTHFYPDLDEAQLQNILTLFRTYQSQHANEEIQLFPKVKETLQALQQSRAELAILTTKNVKQITTITEILEISKFFGVIYGNGMQYGEKPDGSCVTYILSQLTPTSADKVVVVGDSIVDAQTAQNAEVAFLGVSTGVDSSEILKAQGALSVLTNFSALQKWNLYD